jgi:hypothetical protein
MEMEPSRFASYRRIVARGRHITLTLRQRFLVVRDQPTTQQLPETSPPVPGPVEVPNLDLSTNYIPQNAFTDTSTGVTTFTPAILDMKPGETQVWRICNCTSLTSKTWRPSFDLS